MRRGPAIAAEGVAEVKELERSMFVVDVKVRRDEELVDLLQVRGQEVFEHLRQDGGVSILFRG